MNIPPIASIEKALRIYYSHSEIGNREIRELFGRLSSATVARLKKRVKERMLEQSICSYGLHKVNTSIAYEVWGLDVADLERRMKKLKNLDL